MKKIDAIGRAKIIIAMDFIARCITDDAIYDSWLMYGITDGDIAYNTAPEEIIKRGYCDDYIFRKIMELFLRLMKSASNCGGLSYDRVVTSFQV